MFCTDSNDPHKTDDTLGYDQSSKDKMFPLSLLYFVLFPEK